MKQLFLLILVSLTASADPIILHTKAKPEKAQTQVAQTEVEDDDVDGEVILANFSNMLVALGTLTTDPKNPAVAGPALFQALGNVINIIVQACKGIEIRGPVTQQQVQDWFMNLPESVKVRIFQLLIEYASRVRAQHAGTHDAIA
jgi:hypothetical protein